MKKICFLFILPIFLALNASAQEKLNVEDFHSDWGKTNSIDGGIWTVFDLIGTTDEYYYIVSKPNRDPSILQYNMDHKLVNRSRPTITFDGNRVAPENMFTTDAGTYAYSGRHSKKKKRLCLFAGKTEEGKMGKLRKVYQHLHEDKIAFYWEEVIVSSNKEIVTFVSYGEAKNRKKQQLINVAVFDADMQLLWEKQEDIPYRSDDFEYSQIIVLDNQSVFVLGKTEAEKETAVEPDEEEFFIYEFTQENFKEYKLPKVENSETKFACIAALNSSPDKLYFAGVYRDGDLDKKRIDREQGLFTLALADDGSFTSPKHTVFSDSSNIGHGYGFAIDQVFELSDGTWGFLGGTTSSTTSSVGSGDHPSTLTSHGSGKLLLSLFSAEGHPIHHQKIRKSFSSYNPLTAGYLFKTFEDKLYFIGNDAKGRTQAKESGGNRRMVYTDIVVIDSKGNTLLDDVLFTNKDLELDFAPEFSGVSNNGILLGSVDIHGLKYAHSVIRLKK